MFNRTKKSEFIKTGIIIAGVIISLFAFESKTVRAAETVKSVYTNENISKEAAEKRPIAVMIPTDKAAWPAYGISKADILYEIMEEGGISRQLAIIPDWENLSKIGNIRSCRLYYIAESCEWDPILIHCGGVCYMKGRIDAPDINNLSATMEYGVGGKAPGAEAFFRSSDRKAPHNMYISGENIKAACNKLGYSLLIRPDYYNAKHFEFADGINDLSQYGAAAESAETIDLSDVFSYTKTSLTYDSSKGVYMKELKGSPQLDGMNNKQLSFANVIVQNTKWTTLDKKGYLTFLNCDSTEDGYYYTKGKKIHITWKKQTDYEPTKYYDDNGKEIKLNTGKTYIAIAQKKEK